MPVGQDWWIWHGDSNDDLVLVQGIPDRSRARELERSFGPEKEKASGGSSGIIHTACLGIFGLQACLCYTVSCWYPREIDRHASLSFACGPDHSILSLPPRGARARYGSYKPRSNVASICLRNILQLIFTSRKGNIPTALFPFRFCTHSAFRPFQCKVVHANTHTVPIPN